VLAVITDLAATCGVRSAPSYADVGARLPQS
jgi:hypothetical protein